SAGTPITSSASASAASRMSPSQPKLTLTMFRASARWRRQAASQCRGSVWQTLFFLRVFSMCRRSFFAAMRLLDLFRALEGLGHEGAVRRILFRGARGLDDLLHAFQRGDIGGLETRHVGAVPLRGIGFGVGGFHVRHLLQYLGDTVLVFRAEFEAFAH